MNVSSISCENYQFKSNRRNNENPTEPVKIPSFKGVIKIPKYNITIDPKQIAGLTILSTIIAKLGSFSDLTWHMDPWDLHKQVPVIPRGGTKLESWSGYSRDFSTGDNYQLVEKGTISMENGDVYEFENIVETPPHCQHRKTDRFGDNIDPEKSDYENYLGSRTLNNIYPKALVDSDTYTLENATLTRVEK